MDLMRSPRGAWQAASLLIGFYVCAFGILLVLTGIDVVLVLRTGAATPLVTESKVIGATVVVAIPILRGLLMTRRASGDGPCGISVTPQEQPELWARVRSLAEQAGTRAPDEIRLVPMVNAAVSEDTHLMGLLPGRRRMYIGVPLLLGLTSLQLESVLAHELGHYSNRDVQLAATIMRGRAAVLGVAYWCKDHKSFPQGLMSSFFTWYAELYLRASQSVSRRQELAADQMAARIAGRDNTVAALRQLPALEAVYGCYLDRHVSIGWDAGVIPFPEEFYGGLDALLSEPSLQQELEALRSTPPEAEPTPYDSHPPVAERIAAIESLPGGRHSPASAEPRAVILLRAAPHVCAEVARLALPPEAAARRPVNWAELARRAGRASLIRDSALILRTASTALGAAIEDLTTLLDAVDARGLDPIADALPKSEAARHATGRVAREFARTAFRAAVAPLVLLALVDGGRARWTHSWARPLYLEYAEGWEAAVTAALAALIAEMPDTGPLRNVLRGLAPALHSPGPLIGR
jgi:Zn-dependent protease with chaperone function